MLVATIGVPSGGCPMTHSAQSLSVSLAAADDEHARQQVALIKSLLVTVQHFFGGFTRLFGSVTDPRHPVYITYPLPSVLTAGALMFLLRLGARRQVNLMLRQNGPASAKFQALFDVETFPHGDTLDVTYQRLTVPEVQEVITTTVKTLIRKKVLYPYRLRGRYFLVTIDGTGMLTFPERHCPHCLTMTHNGHTTYYHPILEAKLVTRDGFVFSLMTEFIENPSQHPTKQDCELKSLLPAGRPAQAPLPPPAHLFAPGWPVRRWPNLLHLREVPLEVPRRATRR